MKYYWYCGGISILGRIFKERNNAAHAYPIIHHPNDIIAKPVMFSELVEALYG